MATTLVTAISTGLTAATAQAEPSTIRALQTEQKTTAVYRGLDAAQWAARFRQRTHQLHRLRRSMRQRIQLDGSNGVAAGLLCIHGHEGSWTDSGAPFWGGLQMDSGFQSAYGRVFYQALGTADHWPAFVQITVGMAAYYSGRGFGPWPNTRRMCGV